MGKVRTMNPFTRLCTGKATGHRSSACDGIAIIACTSFTSVDSQNRLYTGEKEHKYCRIIQNTKAKADGIQFQLLFLLKSCVGQDHAEGLKYEKQNIKNCLPAFDGGSWRH